METRKEILQELQEVSPVLLTIPAEPVYQVPPGFFASFPDEIMEQIRLNSLFDSASGPVFSVPEDYFDKLPEQVLLRVRSEMISDELNETAPLLSTLSRKEMYTVPDAYFDKIDFMPGTRKAVAEGKVITLRIARKWMQYAAAAVVTGILVTGAFLFTDDSMNYTETEKIEKADVSSALGKVSEQELENYLENHERLMATQLVIVPANEEDLKEVKNNIREVSDEELNQYLNENGETMEIPVSAKDK